MANTYDKINNICLVIIAAFCLGYALVFTKSILIPFVFAIFVHAICSPGISFFQTKCKVHRLIAIALTLLIFLGSSSLLLVFIIQSIQSFLEGASIYQATMYKFIGNCVQLLDKLGFAVDSNNLQNYIRELPIFSWAKNLTGSVVGFLGNSTLVLIFVIFLIAGEGAEHDSNKLLAEVRCRISRYMSVKLLTSLITACIVGSVLFVLGVDLAFMFAVLTFVLNFIPSFGSIIATALPIPVLLLQFGVDWQLFVVLGFCGSTQFIIGNILEPKMMGENMDLHPVTILICLVLWGLLWGLPGLFLSVPITAVIKIVLSRIETTKTFAEVLAGRLP